MYDYPFITMEEAKDILYGRKEKESSIYYIPLPYFLKKETLRKLHFFRPWRENLECAIVYVHNSKKDSDIAMGYISMMNHDLLSERETPSENYIRKEHLFHTEDSEIFYDLKNGSSLKEFCDLFENGKRRASLKESSGFPGTVYTGPGTESYSKSLAYLMMKNSEIDKNDLPNKNIQVLCSIDYDTGQIMAEICFQTYNDMYFLVVNEGLLPLAIESFKCSPFNIGDSNKNVTIKGIEENWIEKLSVFEDHLEHRGQENGQEN